jgi:hypothetical protein
VGGSCSRAHLDITLCVGTGGCRRAVGMSLQGVDWLRLPHVRNCTRGARARPFRRMGGPFQVPSAHGWMDNLYPWRARECRSRAHGAPGTFSTVADTRLGQGIACLGRSAELGVFDCHGRLSGRCWCLGGGGGAGAWEEEEVPAFFRDNLQAPGATNDANAHLTTESTGRSSAKNLLHESAARCLNCDT